MTALNSVLLSVVILLNSACSTVYIPVPLPMPQRPVYAEIRESDVSCLSAQQYSIVAGHIQGQRDYIERLEAVIKSTWSKD